MLCTFEDMGREREKAVTGIKDGGKVRKKEKNKKSKGI